MKKFLFSIALVSLSVSAGAAERVNSKESLRLCKSAVEKDAGDSAIKFKHKTATSVDSGHYVHYINLLEKSESGKESKKLMCKTTRTGEIVSLEIKPGRWKI